MEHYLIEKLAILSPVVHTAAGNLVMGNHGVAVIKKTVGAATQVTLPGRAKSGDFAFVFDGKADAGTNPITIVPDGTTNNTTIDGGANAVITEHRGRAVFMHSGTEWIAVISPGGGMAVGAGIGITAGVGTVYKSSVVKEGGIIKTTILLDLTGLSSATSDLDIIGIAGGPAHIGQITAARNGTIFAGRMTCLEVPASLDDIDLYSATVGTGEFETGIATLVETALLTAGGAWTGGLVTQLSALPAADAFLYLVNGAADTADPFTAGKFLIELFGV